MPKDTNLQELKSLSFDFRQVSSRLMNSDFNDAKKNLYRLINFIEMNPILIEFIRNCRAVEVDFEKEVHNRHQHDTYSVPEDEEGEVSYTFGLLKWFLESKLDYYQLAHGYGSGTKIQNYCDGFNRRIVYPFIQILENKIQKKMMPLNDSSKENSNFQISGPVQQFNYSTGNSRINAFNNSGTISSEFFIQSETFLSLLDKETIDPLKKAELKELVSTLAEELRTEAPKRTFLKLAKDQLIVLASGVSLTDSTATALKKVYDFVETYLQTF